MRGAGSVFRTGKITTPEKNTIRYLLAHACLEPVSETSFFEPSNPCRQTRPRNGPAKVSVQPLSRPNTVRYVAVGGPAAWPYFREPSNSARLPLTDDSTKVYGGLPASSTFESHAKLANFCLGHSLDPCPSVSFREAEARNPPSRTPPPPADRPRGTPSAPHPRAPLGPRRAPWQEAQALGENNAALRNEGMTRS